MHWPRYQQGEPRQPPSTLNSESNLSQRCSSTPKQVELWPDFNLPTDNENICACGEAMGLRTSSATYSPLPSHSSIKDHPVTSHICHCRHRTRQSWAWDRTPINITSTILHWGMRAVILVALTSFNKQNKTVPWICWKQALHSADWSSWAWGHSHGCYWENWPPRCFGPEAEGAVRTGRWTKLP